MKRDDIEPGGVYSLVSYRDQRQGWPVMILDTHAYGQHYRTGDLSRVGRARLVQGSASDRKSAVGLLSVRLAFSMHTPQGEDADGPLMSEQEFQARVDLLRERATVAAAVEALKAGADKYWDDREHLFIKDDQGGLLGTYELLTSLQMVQGYYVTLTLAERAAELERQEYADRAEQQRVANVATYRALAGRLDKLGITGYHCADWESPTRFEKLRFEDLEKLLSLAESAVRANQKAGIHAGGMEYKDI